MIFFRCIDFTGRRLDDGCKTNALEKQTNQKQTNKQNNSNDDDDDDNNNNNTTTTIMIIKIII